MNQYIVNNLKIKLYDTVRIDGLDNYFDFYNKYSNTNIVYKNRLINLEECKCDEYGNYYIFNDINHIFYNLTTICQFSISLPNSPYPYNIEKLKIGMLVSLGKNIKYSPHYKDFNELGYRSINKYFFNKNENEYIFLYDSNLLILDILDDYVKIRPIDNFNQTYVFPCWFLYPSNPELMYKSKLLHI